MRRLERSWALASLLTLMAYGSQVQASPPYVPNHTVPSHFSLVGSSGGVPATDVGGFLVVIRDLANNPIPGATVTIDLALATDLTLCDDQLDPSLTLDCAARTVSAITNAAGQAFFTLVGRGNSTGARTGPQAALVYANGQLIAFPTAAAYDVDGANGLSPNDLSGFLMDFASGQPYGRSDYDGSGSLGAHDLALWLTAFAQATQTASCTGSCP